MIHEYAINQFLIWIVFYTSYLFHVLDMSDLKEAAAKDW